MHALIDIIAIILDLLMWVLIISAVLSWLIAFDVVNRRNRLVDTIWDMTNRLTEPLLRPIRKVIPLLGGIDLSPMVLILIVIFLKSLLLNDIRPMVL